MVWTDSNHDGVSQLSELHSLKSLGITQLNLNATHTALNNNSNWILLDSTYTTVDGKVHDMADVWFQNNGTTVNVAALTPDQVHALTTADIAALTPDQIHVLTTADINALSPNQVLALGTAGISTLTLDQVHALTTVDINALSLDQVHALNTAQIHALDPNQVAALTSVDIAALSPDQVKALTADDITALHNLGKTDSFTAPQIQAILKPHLVNPGLDDVLFSGDVKIHTSVIAGTDQIQLVISGGAHDAVELIGQHGDWKDAGTMLVNGAEHHAYTNGHTQILIQGAVTTSIKEVLI